MREDSTIMSEASNSQSFFEMKYRADVDPWKFASSTYELGRYETTIRALGGRRFARAFEPGCSIGVLTERLAKICDRVEAMDISLTAVRQAQERCRAYRNVTIGTGALPEAIPRHDFDLIVFSEIGYYFDPAALREIAAQLIDHLTIGGVFLAVHWLGSSADHRLTGDQVHELLSVIPGLQPMESQRHEGFRLERWSRV
jgi:protein-L-isoaspartate O-methyltransferase